MGLFHGYHSKLQVWDSCKGYNSHDAAAVRFRPYKYQKNTKISYLSIIYLFKYHYFLRLHRQLRAPKRLHRAFHSPIEGDVHHPAGHAVRKNQRVPV